MKLIIITVYVLIVNCCVSMCTQATYNENIEGKTETMIPTYWVNLESEIERKLSMENHLSKLKYPSTRITAMTPETANVILLERACWQNSYADISILCSHLHAISSALQDRSKFANSSKYALILEDDIRVHFQIDYRKLISTAPNFGSLQLMTSHLDQIVGLWGQYVASNYKNLWTLRPENGTTWSAQAYIINKDVYRERISSIVTLDRHGNQGFKISNSLSYDQTDAEKKNRFKPIVSSACLFADMFVYAIGQPSYILNVPLFNSAGIGMVSSVHGSHVGHHARGYEHHQRAQELMSSNKVPLPNFAKPLPRHLKTMEKAINWTAVCESHPIIHWPQGTYRIPLPTET